MDQSRIKRRMMLVARLEARFPAYLPVEYLARLPGLFLCRRTNNLALYRDAKANGAAADDDAECQK